MRRHRGVWERPETLLGRIAAAAPKTAQAAHRYAAPMPAARSAPMPRCRAIDRRVKPAGRSRLGHRYLDAILDRPEWSDWRSMRRFRAYRTLGSRHTDADHHGGQGLAEKFLREGRFGDRTTQRFDPIADRRRVRLRRGDRHRHRKLHAARPVGSSSSPVQVPRPWQRTDAAHNFAFSAAACRERSRWTTLWEGGFFLTAMNREFPPPRAVASSFPSPTPPGRARWEIKPASSCPPNAPGMRIGLFGGTFDPGPRPPTGRPVSSR